MIPSGISGVEAGANVAHEIGYRLGMDHDGEGNATECDLTSGAGPFVMHPLSDTIRTNFDTRSSWSSCSVASYAREIESLKCLKHGAKSVCGNGIVEVGEACDCGASD